MAEQTTNALVTPSGTIDDEVTANSTTAFDITWAEPDPPTSATFPLTFKGDADDGSDDAIFAVTAITGSSVTNGTWIKVGNQTVFPVGTEIDLSFTDEALRAVIAELIATHDGASTAHASATNLLHTTGAETKAGNLTLTDRLLIPGTATGPPLRVGAANNGLQRATSGTYGLGLVSENVEAAVVYPTGILVNGIVIPTAGVFGAHTDIGATLNVTLGATPNVMVVTQASCTVNLPEVLWADTFSYELFIVDPAGILTALNLVPKQGGAFGTYNDLNGDDATNGAWYRSAPSTTGPFGQYGVLTTPGGLWRISNSKIDTGTGANGGWHSHPLGVIGY